MSISNKHGFGTAIDCLGYTPFGLYCHACKSSLSEKTVLYHLRTKHPDLAEGKSFRGLLAKLRQKLSASLPAAPSDIENYLTGPVLVGYKCPGDDKIFAQRRYARKRLPDGVSSSSVVVVCCRKSICGRLVQIDSMQTIKPKKVLPPLICPHTASVQVGDGVSFSQSLAVTMGGNETRTKICEYVPGDEDVSVYARIFHNVISSSLNLPDTISKLVSNLKPPSESEGDLAWTLEVAKTWLDEYYEIHVNRCPANLRAAMISFDGQVVGDTNMRTTFNCRTDHSTLYKSLQHLICFGWRHDKDPFVLEKHEVSKNLARDQMIHVSTGLIPRILSWLLLETTRSYMQSCIVEEYCFASCFLAAPNSSAGFVFRSCAKSASGFATALHLLRAGVLSYIALLDCPNILEVSSDIVNRSRAGAVVNTISPAIQGFREMAGRKAPKKDRVVTSDGDIVIRDFVFSKSIWSTLIPRLSKIVIDLMANLFEGDGFKTVLDISMPLQVTFIDGSVELYMELGPDKTLDNNDLRLAQAPNLAVFDRLTSAVELMHHGVGLGALRQSENRRLSVHSVQYTCGCLYYFSEPIKRFSSNQHTMPKLVEHKLPCSLTRQVVLFRWLVGRLGLGTKLWIPGRTGRKHTMTDTISEVFRFEGRPTALDVRQYVASLCNILFPAGGDFLLEEECLTSEDSISEQSGHAASTHQQRYASWMKGSLEAKYEHFHRSLGEVVPFNSNAIRKNCSLPIHLKLLRQSLQILLHNTANFRDDNQQCMVMSAANTLRRHCHASVRCGSGKSMTWILSSFASYLRGDTTSVSIIITPYKFLNMYHVIKAEALFGKLATGPTVGTIATSSIPEDVLPNSVRDVHNLPNLLFMSVDAIARLVDCHWETLQSWACSGLLRKIYIDEIHTLPSEYSFRPCYQRLSKLSKLAIPMMTMSGSIPVCLAHCIAKYLGTTSDNTNFDLIDGGDPVGEGFSLNVKKVNGHTAANAASETISHLKRYPGTAVHVICSTKLYAESVGKLLNARGIRASVVTGESSSEEQKSIATAWYNGESSVLVSTTVALVGNENPRCRHIVVCGLLYHLSNLVQAFGRLRPEQRGTDSFVTVMLRSRGEPTLAKQIEDDIQSHRLMLSAGLFDKTSIGFIHNVYGVKCLQETLMDDTQCLLQSISEKFGYQRDVCQRCCNCVEKHPVQMLAARAIHVATPLVDNRRVCYNLLLELAEKCICGSSQCNGTSCLKQFGMRCYRCGEKHGVRDCSFDIDKCLRGLACSKCWELYSIYPMHKHTDCRVNYRLRALLLRYVRTNRPSGGLPALVEEMMTSEDAWFHLVSRMRR